MYSRKSIWQRMEFWETSVLPGYCCEDHLFRNTQNHLLMRNGENINITFWRRPVCYRIITVKSPNTDIRYNCEKIHRLRLWKLYWKSIWLTSLLSQNFPKFINKKMKHYKVIIFSHRLPPTFPTTGAKDETFCQSWKHDFFKQKLTISSNIY